MKKKASTLIFRKEKCPATQDIFLSGEVARLGGDPDTGIDHLHPFNPGLTFWD